MLIISLLFGWGCEKSVNEELPESGTNANNPAIVPSMVVLKGRIVNPKHPAVVLSAPGLNISLMRDGQVMAQASIPDGQFEFTNLEAGHHYTLVPSTSGVACGAVTALDMLTLKKHIEGIQPMNLFSQISADVNKDLKLDQLDVDRYQKIISGDADLMKESCTSLRFYNLSAANPFQYGQMDRIEYATLNTSLTNIQIGFIHPCDVNKYTE